MKMNLKNTYTVSNTQNCCCTGSPQWDGNTLKVIYSDDKYFLLLEISLLYITPLKTLNTQPL